MVWFTRMKNDRFILDFFESVINLSVSHQADFLCVRFYFYWLLLRFLVAMKRRFKSTRGLLPNDFANSIKFSKDPGLTQT